MSEMREFQTTSIHLATAVLTHLPRAALLRITPDRSIDGKRAIIMQYPAEQSDAFQQILEDFQRRRLTVPLYRFNRALNLLRDHLLQHERSHAIR